MGLFFTISEFGKHHGISRRTLLHYDEIGLLSPYKKDENGYRYYSSHQHTELATILTLKELGVSLDHIQQIIATRNPQLLSNIYTDLLKKTDYHIDRLTHTRFALKSRLDRFSSLNDISFNLPKVHSHVEETFTYVTLTHLKLPASFQIDYSDVATDFNHLEALGFPGILDGEPWGFVFSQKQRNTLAYGPTKLIKRRHPQSPLTSKNNGINHHQVTLYQSYVSAFSYHSPEKIEETIQLLMEYSQTKGLVIDQSQLTLLFWKDSVDTPVPQQEICEVRFSICP